MTITPDQARELLYGTTPGPWEMVYEEWENPEGIPCESWTVCDKSDGLMDATDFDAATHDPAANTALAAAAPDMAETIAEMQWEYGVEQATGTTRWFRSRPMAEAHAEAWGAFRLVRKLVGPVEVIDGE